MTDNSLREVGTFSTVLDTNSSTNIIQYLDVGNAIAGVVENLDPRWIFRPSFYLESLRLTVDLPSFRAAPFPEVYAGDTSAEKMAKLLEVEQSFPKVGLKLLRKHSNETDWHDLATVVLQNRGRQSQLPIIVPYLTINQIKLLSKNDLMACQVVNYGSGILGAGDRLQLEGEWRCDVDVAFMANRPTAINYYSQSIGQTPFQLTPANPNRARLTLQNQSDTSLYFQFGSNASVLDYGFLLPGGGTATEGELNNLAIQEALWVKSVANNLVYTVATDLSYV
ncbi:MAG: hypothetical protein VKK42_02805 [Lyngbya sp.]|nr:hypothetical protein [Lyngbya sp.]